MIAIVDYGMGNLFSVQKAFKRLKADVVITSDSKLISGAEKIILPGVGHFGKAMSFLQELDLIEVLKQHAVVERKPILGICLGMQLFAEYSEEGFVNGLGWIPGQVKRMMPASPEFFKIPQMGWNTVQIKKESELNNGLLKDDEFYFVHSYHFVPDSNNHILHQCTYHEDVVAAVQLDNIYGVQYHPEKSHDSGLKILGNFLAI